MAVEKKLVLGGDGLIGRSLCSILEAAGHVVTSLELKAGFDLRGDSMEPFF